jgi:hypothetical protein
VAAGQDAAISKGKRRIEVFIPGEDSRGYVGQAMGVWR